MAEQGKEESKLLFAQISDFDGFIEQIDYIYNFVERRAKAIDKLKFIVKNRALLSPDEESYLSRRKQDVNKLITEGQKGE